VRDASQRVKLYTVKIRRLVIGALLGVGATLALAGQDWMRPAAAELTMRPEKPVTRPALEPRVVLFQRDVRSDPPPPRFIPVSGDVPAWVEPAFVETDQAIVYLHGMCGEPTHAADFAEVAARHGTLIALRGDVGCKGGGTYWRGDPTFLDYRIKKAVRSVSAALGRPLDETSLVLLGYSQGAQRAEDLAWTFPKRYARVALMSGPSAPRFDRVRRLARLAIVRGQREYRKTYREAATNIDRGGVPARFFVLPGAAHGQFGPDAPTAMSGVFDFLFAEQR
jgi:pimeloyl-ACP methyl ester carboxylesterase